MTRTDRFINRLIIFLLRTKFGLKKTDYFRFTNQKSEDSYRFEHGGLMKYFKTPLGLQRAWSSVSLNWLLDSHCEVKLVNCDPVVKEVYEQFLSLERKKI